MERLFGSLKSERLADQRNLAHEKVRRGIDQAIEMAYSSNQLHSTLGYITRQEQQMGVAA